MTGHVERRALYDGAALATRAVHAGQYPEDHGGAVAVPVHFSSTFERTVVLDGGWDYSRIANPTRSALEHCLAALEGGAGSVATASGMAATTTTVDAENAITADERADAVAAAETLAVLLHQRLVLRDRDHARATHLLELLLDAGPAERSAAAADLLRHGFVDDDAHVGVLVTHAGNNDDDVRAAVHHACRPLPPTGRLVTAARKQATVLLASRRPITGPLRATADAVAAALPGARVGLSAPSQGLGAAAAARRQAQVALSVAEALDDKPGVVAFAELGPYALLGQLPPDLVHNELLPLGLFTLLRLGAGHELLHTLEVFLDCAGDKQRAAQVLAVHRSTLYHRLDRIEQLSGLDLADGGDRLLAHLAVKLLRIGRTR